MNPEIPQPTEIKRGPGRPRKETQQPSEFEKATGLLMPSGFEIDRSQPQPDLSKQAVKFEAVFMHPAQSLGDLYTAIEAAPPEWLPSLLAKVVKTSLKSGAWSDVENLILSVRGFAK